MRLVLILIVNAIAAAIVVIGVIYIDWRFQGHPWKYMFAACGLCLVIGTLVGIAAWIFRFFLV